MRQPGLYLPTLLKSIQVRGQYQAETLFPDPQLR